MYLLVTALEDAMGDQPLVVPKLEHQGTPKTLHMHAQTVSLLCKPGLWCLWETLLAAFRFIPIFLLESTKIVLAKRHIT